MSFRKMLSPQKFGPSFATVVVEMKTNIKKQIIFAVLGDFKELGVVNFLSKLFSIK
jgi:hypothetical protein